MFLSCEVLQASQLPSAFLLVAGLLPQADPVGSSGQRIGDPAGSATIQHQRTLHLRGIAVLPVGAKAFFDAGDA